MMFISNLHIRIELEVHATRAASQRALRMKQQTVMFLGSWRVAQSHRGGKERTSICPRSAVCWESTGEA